MNMVRIVMRGIGYRPGRSLVVLGLAIIATAAAVLNPAYTQAAHQSLLTDAMDRLPASANGMRVGTAVSDLDAAEPAMSVMNDTVSGLPGMSVFTAPLEYAEAQVRLDGDDLDFAAMSSQVYRQSLCEHVDIVDGVCDTSDTEVLVSERAAGAEGLAVGDTIDVFGQYDEDGSWAVTIAGVYRPHDTGAGYWGRSAPFRTGTDPRTDTALMDALFVTNLDDLSGVGAALDVGLEYRFRPNTVNLSNVDDIVASTSELDGHSLGVQEAGRIDVASSIESVANATRAEQEAVSTSVPVVTVPLVLLCWFVLYLVVFRLTEERSPQIALAKLRGHRYRAVTGFGTGEAALLIGLGAPLGTIGGMALVGAVARFALAPGTNVEFTPAIPAYALIALAGGLGAMLLAARHTLNRSVLGLLRAVPTRATWRAGLVEGGVVALAAVAVWQVTAHRGAGVFAMFTTPLLALVAGMAVARGIEWYARLRQPRARRRGAITRMLAYAQLSRRADTRRVVVLVTVAVALVTFGVCAWDVAKLNREMAADDQLGADRVYQLGGADPQTLIDTVNDIDPDRDSLMGVMRLTDRYAGEPFTLVAAQTDRLAQVVRWRDHSAADLARLSEKLKPEEPEPLRITGTLEIDTTVDNIDSRHPMQLVARVASPGSDPQTLRLGELDDGDGEYHIDVPQCADGCQLISVGASRYPGDYDTVDVSMRVTAIRDASGDVDAGLDRSDAWRPAWNLSPATRLDLAAGNEGLDLSASTDKADDLLAEYVTAPAALPAVLAGPVPNAELGDGRFDYLGPHDELQPYQRISSAQVIPGGGPGGMLVDLDDTVQFAQAVTSLRDKDDLNFQVWAAADAPDDLADRLAAAGLVVTQVHDRADELTRSGRAAPALALRLYLLAGAAAFGLVIGVALLTSTMGARARAYDTAALRVAGVPRRMLRRAALREQLLWIVPSLVAGVAVGLIGLVLVLPGVSLVTTAPPVIPIEYRIGPWWFSGALAAITCGFGYVLRVALRGQSRRGVPARLRREG